MIETLTLAAVVVFDFMKAPQYDSSTMTVFVTFVALLVGAGIFPVPCCVALPVLFTVSTLVVPEWGFMQLLGVAYALGTLTYDVNLVVGGALAAPVVAALCYQSWRVPNMDWNLGHTDAPLLVFLLLLVLFFAHASREQSKNQMNRVKVEQAEELKRRVDLAGVLHDSIAGDLANIARISQRQERLSDSDREREAWSQINDRSIRVLDSVHAVIRQLHGAQDAAQTEVGEPGSSRLDSNDDGESRRARDFAGVITEHAAQWRRRLYEIGLRGGAQVIDHRHGANGVNGANIANGRLDANGVAADDLRERRQCILGLVDEAFANIMKHGIAGDNVYNVVVTIEDGGVEIVATNPLVDERLAGDDHDLQPYLPGGNGLQLHREQAERFGGVLTTDAEDGEWLFYARVPLMPKR